MRICAVMKYPPIQGGVSAQCYWLARGLAESGHEVHVVTNASEVEDEYRILLDAEDRILLEHTSASGGRVRLYATEPSSRKLMHIPQSNPFVSRLAGLTADVVRRNDCQAIFSYYLEPYGVAAHMAAAWTGVPHLVHHAGSDFGRLMNQPGLATTYREVFRRADAVFSGNAFAFLGLGVEPEAIYQNPLFHLPEVFHPDAEPLDLDAHVAEVGRRAPDAVSSPGSLDPEVPTIGIYGKMGVTKGSYDLLSALGKLREQGLRFNFVAVTRGTGMEEYRRGVEDRGLREVTWLLPFMPHWKVPRFLRACDAVCFLERDFPITFHTPSIPREILACGTCLILSGEIADKQHFQEPMVPDENFLLVPDPKHHDELAAALRRVIADPDWAAEVGRKGAELVAGGTHRNTVEAYETVFEDVIRRRAGEPSGVSREDRRLPAGRAEGIRILTPALGAALGDRAGDLLEAFLEPSSPAPDSLFDDALAWCRHLHSSARQPPEDLSLAETARYAELMVWLGHLEPEEETRPLFDRFDLQSGLPWEPGAVRELAPLKSRWVRLERFSRLPAGLPADAVPAGEEEHWFVFHKQPSMNGRHFRVNRFTADLLHRCRGDVTVGGLIRHYQRQTQLPLPEVTKIVVPALRRFYGRGLIVLTEAAGESG